ncbi:succinate dehydrogenase cytochrome b subunit [Anaerolineales bacterium HSG24]|nr:succinate dehydrogenase cytochrome b subunit [Anaerolineales bacterium HSG24]
MVGILHFPNTTIGKKIIMALSGAIWLGFLAGHMVGNLKIFMGAEHFNEYAHGLRTLGEPILVYGQALWIARLVVVPALVLHVWAAITLSLLNMQARDSKYVQHRKLNANAAQLSMIFGGIALFLFIIFHLMHFTLGVLVHPSFNPNDPYHNVIAGFQSYFYIPAVIYLIALAALSLHLYHGTWSMFQTLGLNNKTYTKSLRILAWLVAISITAGFALVPLSVMFGVVG